jgi:hypothetical protein
MDGWTTELILGAGFALLSTTAWALKVAFDRMTLGVTGLESAVNGLRDELIEVTQRLSKIEEWQRIYEMMKEKA